MPITRAPFVVAFVALVGMFVSCGSDEITAGDATMSSSSSGLTHDEFLSICNSTPHQFSYEWGPYDIPPELYTLPDIRDTPDEQALGCSGPTYPVNGNYNILYEDYHGHEGCSMVIGEACAFGWLLHNDDPLDPEALKEHEHLCEGCSPDNPCTHVFISTLANGEQHPPEVWPQSLTVCQTALVDYWSLGPYDERNFSLLPAPRVFVEKEGKIYIEYYTEGCSCTCNGVITGCSTKGLEPLLVAPYEPLPIETDPLTLVTPHEMTIEDATPGGWWISDIWCSIGQCLYDEGIFPTDLENPPSNPDSE